jgi:hypothetical protein
MAVNHADGTMFVSVLFYPIAAAIAAAHSGAGWFTVLFIPAGLAIGIGVCYMGRKLIYSLVGFGLSRTSKTSKSWIQQVAFAPFFVLYMILPYAIGWAGISGTWFGSIWLVKHML